MAGLGIGLATVVESGPAVGIPAGLIAAAGFGLIMSLAYRQTVGKAIEIARIRRQEIRNDAALYLEQEIATEDPAAKRQFRDLRVDLLLNYAASIEPPISRSAAPIPIEAASG